MFNYRFGSSVFGDKYKFRPLYRSIDPSLNEE